MIKKDGLLKRLKNFEGKNEEKNQLKTIKSQVEKQLKEIIDKTSIKIGLIKNTPFLKKSTFEGKKLEEIAQQEKKINYRELVFVRPGDVKTNDFSRYRRLHVLFQETYFGSFLLKDTYNKQIQFENEASDLKIYGLSKRILKKDKIPL